VFVLVFHEAMEVGKESAEVVPGQRSGERVSEDMLRDVHM